MATSTLVGHTSQEDVEKIAQLKRDFHAIQQTKDVARQQVVPVTFTDLLALCHHEVAEVQVEDQAKYTKSTEGKIGNQLLPHPLREYQIRRPTAVDLCSKTSKRRRPANLVQERTLPPAFKFGTDVESHEHANQLAEGKGESLPSKGARSMDQTYFSKSEDNENSMGSSH
ncbi:hypothetical protein BDR22DRAFT_827211 [Usnea florida]